MSITLEQLDLWEKESEEYVEEWYEQFPDSGAGYTLCDNDYNIKQEAFLEGVYWILQKIRKLKEEIKNDN